jgi:TPR repeat protein
MLERVEGAIDAGDLTRAATLVDRLPAMRASEHRARLAYILDTGLSRPREAEELYRQALPQSGEALVDLTLMLDEQGRGVEAERLLRAQERGREAFARVSRGRHYRAAGETSRALDEYRRGVELGDVAALRYLAGTLSYEGRTDEARQLYADPPIPTDDVALQLDHVDLLQDLEERPQAELILGQLASRDVPAAHRLLADIYSGEDGDIDRASAHYLAAVAGGDLQALTNLGATWLDASRLGEAELVLRAAWERKDALAGRNLAKLLDRTGLGDEARIVRKWAAQLGDESSTAHVPEMRREAKFPRQDDASRSHRLWADAGIFVRQYLGRISVSAQQPVISTDTLELIHGAQLVQLLRQPDHAQKLDQHFAVSRWGGESLERQRAIAELRSWWRRVSPVE